MVFVGAQTRKYRARYLETPKMEPSYAKYVYLCPYWSVA
jgi:hypothetical protein